MTEDNFRNTPKKSSLGPAISEKMYNKAYICNIRQIIWKKLEFE